MKNSEVFIAKCLHYNPTSVIVCDALDDVGLKPDDECEDKRVVVKAVLGYLSGVLSLSSEKEVDCSNTYDREGLKSYICMLCRQFNYDASVFLSDNSTEIEDGSDRW